mgnify:CR=1 FL=1
MDINKKSMYKQYLWKLILHSGIYRGIIIINWLDKLINKCVLFINLFALDADKSYFNKEEKVYIICFISLCEMRRLWKALKY